MMQTHTFVMHIFLSTRQKKEALLSHQCNVCSLYTWDRFVYVCKYAYLSRHMLKHLETTCLREKQLHIVSIKDTTQFFSYIAPWINSLNGLHHRLQNVNYLLSCLLELLKC